MVAVLALSPAVGPPLPVAWAGSASVGSSLFAQSAARILERDFTGREVSFLLLDVHSGAVLASRWDDAGTPIPMGSLVKPFTALAYGEEHQFRYPTHVCLGGAGGCWLPRGHGEVGIASAIADSCNSYFRMLTANMTSADVVPAAGSFGLDPPAPQLSGPDLIGIGNLWRISPLHMAHAYLELNRRREQPGVREVVEGMAQSARQGTGSAVDRALLHSSALVKTGTAACTHHDHAPGDGFVVALVPAEQPEVLLMVRVHGVPGARAALTAGRMLRRIEE
ncbi:MAG: penicillin-binding transpeptidase domain-containing protein [Terriglobales bacterium]